MRSLEFIVCMCTCVCGVQAYVYEESCVKMQISHHCFQNLWNAAKHCHVESLAAAARVIKRERWCLIVN